MDMVVLLIGMMGFFFFISLISIFYFWPFRSLLWNRWKLKMLAKKGYMPVYIRYKNRKVEEIVVNTKETTFDHKECRYNVREEHIHDIGNFRCLYYEVDNPEPLAMMNEEDKEFIVKMADGSVANIKGKLVDAKTYDQTCLQFYYAGISFANRNKNLMMILLIITLAVVVIGTIAIYFKVGQSGDFCKNTILNATSIIQSQSIKPIVG